MQSFKMAFRSIAGNKMRSFLTMLGIIIGVASVIMLVSLVTGYMNSMMESFASMGVDQINVSVTNTASRTLEPDEMYDFIEENSSEFAYITPTVSLNARIKNGSETLSRTQIGGYSEDYITIKGYEIETGRNISYADLASNKKVAVMGYYTAWYMFGSPENAIGQNLKISGNMFTVVGVVARQDETKLSEGGTDDFVWIPYTAAAKMNRARNISSYILTVKDVTKADEDTGLVEDFLYTVFKNDDLYTVTANSAMLEEMNSMINQISLMLGGIAGISLLVAGVGVMNIMLVSVTERTREIGIRKAIGAKQSAILMQFVIEAAVTSTLGGLIGIVIGSVFTGVIGRMIGINAAPTLGAIVISFSVSVAIGLIFGYMPARRAAKLNPIDALRSE
ncbi:MAG: ABC transporter permease [Eubacteriales bacterium]|nr:ABC transporter permease [Eubacteriales bacterium]